MLAKLARGMLLFFLATLIVVYIFSGDRHEVASPTPPDQVIGYLSA